MDDRSLVSALRSGDVRGLAGVYDGYADRLLAYAVTLLRDRDAAADAVHDALLVARARIGQLRDQDRLRPWLYAIVRTECVRRLRDRRRSVPPDDDAEQADPAVADADRNARTGGLTDPAAEDPGRNARAGGPRELVLSAAATLDPGDREVLELTARHGLAGADLAAALGVDTTTAEALSSRARAQLDRSLAALLVARTGRDVCPELAGLLAGWDGALTPLVHTRLARHVDGCETCGGTTRRTPDPAALLAGIPFVLAPSSLRDRVLRDVSYQAGRPGRWQPDGFPVPLDRRRVRGSPIWWSAAAVAVLALLLTTGLVLRPGGGSGDLTGAANEQLQTALPVGDKLTGDGAKPSTANGVSTSPTSSTGASTPQPTGPPLPTRTSPTPTGTPLPTSMTPRPTSTTPLPTPSTPRPTPTTPPPTTTPAPAPTVTTQWALVTPACPSSWQARLTATVAGTTATGVTASISGGSGPSSVAMTAAGGVWTALVNLPAGQQLSWTATATTAAGRLRSASKVLHYDCVP